MGDCGRQHRRNGHLGRPVGRTLEVYRDRGQPGQLQVEAHIAAGGICLVHLHRDHVVAGHKEVRDLHRGVPWVIGRRRRVGTIPDIPRRHVVAGYLLPVEIHDTPIIAQNAQIQQVEGRRILHSKGVPEVVAGVLVARVAAIGDRRDLIPIAIAEFRRSGRPFPVVIAGFPPFRSQIGAGVIISPNRTLGDQVDRLEQACQQVEKVGIVERTGDQFGIRPRGIDRDVDAGMPGGGPGDIRVDTGPLVLGHQQPAGFVVGRDQDRGVRTAGGPVHRGLHRTRKLERLMHDLRE